MVSNRALASAIREAADRVEKIEGAREEHLLFSSLFISYMLQELELKTANEGITPALERMQNGE